MGCICIAQRCLFFIFIFIYLLLLAYHTVILGMGSVVQSRRIYIPYYFIMSRGGPSGISIDHTLVWSRIGSYVMQGTAGCDTNLRYLSKFHSTIPLIYSYRTPQPQPLFQFTSRVAFNVSHLPDTITLIKQSNSTRLTAGETYLPRFYRECKQSIFKCPSQAKANIRKSISDPVVPRNYKGPFE